MKIHALERTFGRESENRLEQAKNAGFDGALAAVESFYHAFNQRDARLLAKVWAEDDLVQLNNPLGGILRGIDSISALYKKVFNGPARVWVAFHDIVVYPSEAMVVFAGRERGEFAAGGTVIPLAIRTSRIFAYADGRWAQVHHHGSIDDVALLADYQTAVRG